MTKPLAIIWAAFTALPLVYIVYFIFYMFDSFVGVKDPTLASAEFTALFKLHIANMLLIWLLMAAYIVYVFRTEYVPKDKKALWAVVLFMGNLFAMPIFWFIYVWQPLRTSARG